MVDDVQEPEASAADDAQAPVPTGVDWAIPNWRRDARLESVLESRLADITWDVMDTVVKRHASEDLGLDFKRSHYVLDRAFAKTVMPDADAKAVAERITKDQRELAKDVTALANATGGLIVVGVADTNGRAETTTPVALKDKFRLAYLETIRRWTTPFVSGIELGHVPCPADPATGLVLIYVPASASRPHAVVEPNTYRHTWFVRDGARVMALSEPQIAAAYRDRFAGHDDVEQQARETFEEGLRGLERQANVWLAVAVAPSFKAPRRPLDRRLLDEFKTQTHRRQTKLPGARLGDHGTFGRSRVVLRDSQPGILANDGLLHLYSDGRAFAGVVLDVLQDPGAVEEVCRQHPELGSGVRCIRVGSLSTWVLSLLGLVCGHAVDAGSSGDLEVMCSLVAATAVRDPDDLSPPVEQPAMQHVVIDQPWRHSTREPIVPATTWLTAPTPVRLTLSSAVAGELRELIAVSSQLVSEVVAEFGYLPSDPLFTPEGFVVGEHCAGSRLDGLRGWAAGHRLLLEQQDTRD